MHTHTHESATQRIKKHEKKTQSTGFCRERSTQIPTRRVIRTHIWATAYIPPGEERYTSHDIHSLTHAKTSPVKWLLWMPPVRMGSDKHTEAFHV